MPVEQTFEAALIIVVPNSRMFLALSKGRDPSQRAAENS